MNNDDLLEEDLVKFAAKHYYSPLERIDPDEFYADLKRFKYIKRLLTRYIETGEMSERLILNHIIIIFNAFGNYGSIRLLGLKLTNNQWSVIKPFLKYLNYVRESQLSDIKSDIAVEEKLKRL